MSITRFLSLVVIALQSSAYAGPTKDIVASDLFDEQAIALLVPPTKTIQDSKPNRHRDTVGAASHSTRVYFYDRYTAIARLSEYPTDSDAKKAYEEDVATMVRPTVVQGTTILFKLRSDGSVGDKANWYELEPTQYGYTVLKGRFTFGFEINLKRVTAEASLQAKIRPLVQAAVKKLN